jgi:hypothetical protein
LKTAREPLPGTLVPLPNFTSLADIFNINNYITRPIRLVAAIDPYAGVPPEFQARRLWSEALLDYFPHFYRGTFKIFLHMVSLAIQFLYFHCSMHAP